MVQNILLFWLIHHLIPSSLSLNSSPRLRNIIGLFLTFLPSFWGFWRSSTVFLTFWVPYRFFSSRQGRAAQCILEGSLSDYPEQNIYKSNHSCNITITPRWLSGKGSTCQSRRHQRCKFNRWVGKIPWTRDWESAQVFLPGKSHEQRTWWATVHGVIKNQTQLRDWAHGDQPQIQLKFYSSLSKTFPPRQ